MIPADYATARRALEESWRRVRSRAARPPHGWIEEPPHDLRGPDGVSIEDFERHIERELDELADELASCSYSPFPFLEFVEPKPSGGERRLVLPAIRDRVVASAAGRSVSDRLDAGFSESSFAYRPGRSIYDCWIRIDALRRAGLSFGWRADVASCFASIASARALEALIMVDIGGSLFAAVQSLLGAKRTDGIHIHEPPPGLPEGLAVSPVLANLVLDAVDKRLELRDVAFLRYADDILVLAATEDEAAERGVQLAGFLAEIGLAIGEEKTGPVSFETGFRYVGADFVGEEVLRDGASVARSSDGALDPLGRESEPRPNPSLGAPWLDALPAQPSSDDDPDATAVEDEEDAAELGDAVFLRTLYIEGQDRSVGKEGRRFVVKEAAKRIGAVQSEKIGQIILFPGAYATTPALRLAIEEDIPVTFIGYGTFGRLESTNRDRVGRQRLQFLRAEDPSFAFSFAASSVQAKIENSRRLLRRRAGEKRLDALDRMVDQVDRLRLDPEAPVKKLERLRGIEGAASAAYFDEWPALLAGTRFEWRGRRRRPPPDPINAMLSFGYTLLFYNIYSIVRLHGLHPYVGHLHLIKEGHPALVSDLIEEWRAPVVDSAVLSLVRKRVVGPEDFAIPEREGAACLLGDAARRRFIEAFERRMRVVVTHPVTGWRVTYRRGIEVQVRAFIRFLEGRADCYDPFVWET